MSPDDAADLVADLSDETREELLALMERDEAAELGGLLAYPEYTAGGLMTTEFVAVPAHLTAGETIDRLRELEPDAETIYYVYVVDDDGRLVGVLSLRDLIVAKPSTPIGEVMIEEPVPIDVTPTATTWPVSWPATTCWPCRSSTPTTASSGSSPSTTPSTPSCPPTAAVASPARGRGASPCACPSAGSASGSRPVDSSGCAAGSAAGVGSSRSSRSWARG